MRWLPLVLLLGGCQLLFKLEDEPPAGAARRRSVTIRPPTSKLLEGFPVGVWIDDDSLLDITSAANIRFVDAAGTELASELIFDPTAHTLEAWVKIEALQSDLEIALEYGGDVAHETDPRLVWGDGPAGEAPTVVSVWHLSEVEPGIARDSGNDINGSNNLLEIPGSDAQPVGGAIGNGRRFDGDDALCAASGFNYQFESSTLSWGVWVNVADNAMVGEFDQPLSKGGGNNSNPGFNFELGSDEWSANLCCDDNPVKTNFHADTASTNDRWVHLVAVTNPADSPTGTLRLYVDNGLAEMVPIEDTINQWGNASTMLPLCVGGSSEMLRFHGDIDEVRVYNAVLAPEWIVTETYNVTDRDQFIELGEPEPL